VHSERDVLLRFLDRSRDAVARATEGLTEEQLRTPVVPSGTTLLGLLGHPTEMEVHWFGRVFRGEPGELPGHDGWEVAPGTTGAAAVAAYRAACARSDEVVFAEPDLSAIAAAVNPGEDERVALRRILGHLVEETSRHAGHADVLRELIDGVTAS